MDLEVTLETLEWTALSRVPKEEGETQDYRETQEKRAVEQKVESLETQVLKEEEVSLVQMEHQGIQEL